MCRRIKSILDELVYRAALESALGSGLEQRQVMVNFIGMVLLAVLCYDGHYYD